jgi:glyoxylase-like metal-dependent hydrolase (beta-lactamase superfamily II)
MTSTAPSTKPLPPVEQVRPGLWSIPVPLPIPLRYVFVYAFETGKGPFLVDAGWNTDDAFDALSAGLRQGGFEMADVQGVMVTHIHPDHYGLAGRVREASGAWISLHPADARLIQDRYIEPADLLERVSGMLRRMGAPPDEVKVLTGAAMPVRPLVDPVLPDVLLEDGARPEVPGWDLSAIWTPGHTPGHLCFWEPANELLLTGDHVLPRITPNISYNPQAGDDPLGDFLRALDRLEEYQPREVLPAHEHRFVGLHRRLQELRDHHAQRFREVLVAIQGGHTTAWEIASRMVWSRPWDQIDGWMRRAAVSEAVAHLVALDRRGVVVEEVGEPSHWALSERAEGLLDANGGTRHWTA